MPLPHQLSLLSHQPAKGRLDDDSDAVRGSLLCGAAVAELCLGGWLRDRGGKAERTTATVPANLDPFLLKDRVDHELPGLRPALIPSIALRRAG